MRNAGHICQVLFALVLVGTVVGVPFTQPTPAPRALPAQASEQPTPTPTPVVNNGDCEDEHCTG